MHHVSRFPFPVLALLAAPLDAQQTLPPLPDTTGFGVHVLALGRAPDDAVWVGTYGQGIFVLRRGAGSWEQFKHSDDSTARTISFDFVHAFGFGPVPGRCTLRRRGVPPPAPSASTGCGRSRRIPGVSSGWARSAASIGSIRHTAHGSISGEIRPARSDLS